MAPRGSSQVIWKRGKAVLTLDFSTAVTRVSILAANTGFGPGGTRNWLVSTSPLAAIPCVSAPFGDCRGWPRGSSQVIWKRGKAVLTLDFSTAVTRVSILAADTGFGPGGTRNCLVSTSPLAAIPCVSAPFGDCRGWKSGRGC